jgi:hypothetical protein
MAYSAVTASSSQTPPLVEEEALFQYTKIILERIKNMVIGPDVGPKQNNCAGEGQQRITVRYQSSHKVSTPLCHRKSGRISKCINIMERMKIVIGPYGTQRQESLCRRGSAVYYCSLLLSAQPNQNPVVFTASTIHCPRLCPGAVNSFISLSENILQPTLCEIVTLVLVRGTFPASLTPF